MSCLKSEEKQTNKQNLKSQWCRSGVHFYSKRSERNSLSHETKFIMSRANDCSWHSSLYVWWDLGQNEVEWCVIEQVRKFRGWPCNDTRGMTRPKLQASIYDILPPITAVTGYAIGLRKLPATWQNGFSLVHKRQYVCNQPFVIQLYELFSLALAFFNTLQTRQHQ